MEAIRGYLLCVTATAMVCGICRSLCCSGAVGRSLRFCCGLAILLVALCPLTKIDTSALLRQFRNLEQSSVDITQQAQAYNRSQMEMLISEKTAAYILDKAPPGQEITVSVTTAPVGEFACVPDRIYIGGLKEERHRQMITQLITRDLGLTEEQIQWTLP